MAKGLIYRTNATTHEPVMEGNKVMEFANDDEATEYATVDSNRGDRAHAVVDLDGLSWQTLPPYEGKKEEDDEDEDDDKTV